LILDTGYRMQDSRYRISDTGFKIQEPETRIQDQSILATVFIAFAKFEYSILCNNRIYSTERRARV
jgi:hypothetical protein